MAAADLAELLYLSTSHRDPFVRGASDAARLVVRPWFTTTCVT